MAFAALDKDGPTKAAVIRTIKTVSTWRNHLSIYGTEENILKAEAMVSEVERLLESCGAKVERKSKCVGTTKRKRFSLFCGSNLLTVVSGLFQKDVQAFKNLATDADLESLASLYDEYFHENLEADAPVINPSTLLPFSMEGTGVGDLGMEHEAALPPDALAARIGFSRQHLPYQFNPLRHSSGLTAWEHPVLFDVEPPPDYLTKNRLYWHQMAAVHSFARNVFTTTADPNHCTGMLISDEVGLGKTALAISVLGFLNQCISLQDRKQSLPSVLGERLSFLTLYFRFST
jgi:TATA-binding protein-associated factor